MVAARVSSSGIWVDPPGQESVHAMAGEVGVAAGAHAESQGAQYFFGNPRGQVLRTRVLVDDGVPHSGEAALRQTFPRPQQPTPVGPLWIELTAPGVAQFPR
jgi:hypothetical protein